MRSRRELTWGAGVFGSAILLAEMALAARSGSPTTINQAALQTFDVAAVLWVGAYLSALRPSNAVGHVLLAGGFLATLLLLLTAYANYAVLIVPSAPVGTVALIGEQVVWPLVSLFLICLLPLLFPDGKFLSYRWRWFAIALGAVTLVPIFGASFDPLLQLPYGMGTVRNPIGLDVPVLRVVKFAWSILFAAGVVIAFASLAIRYRLSDAERRRQIRWVVAAVGLTLASLAAQQAARAVTPSLAFPDWAFQIPLATIPVAIAVAVLRHRLFDIDLVVRRSLVYGVLWIGIVLVYAGLAAALGLVAGQRLSVQAAILVTIGATLVFQPARSRLERLADRLAYGRRAGAYEVLRDLGAASERTADLADIGPSLADAVKAGMGAAWARVLVKGGTPEEEVVLASIGEVGGSPALSAPLIRGDELVGRIECGPRLAGAFNDRDREILMTIGRQAALAIHNAALTTELERRLSVTNEQARELAASKARLVQAQEAERRRIERDLHDGIQQQLISLVAGIRLARNRIRAEPEQVDQLLSQVQEHALQSVKGLRELVRGIHPTVLADAGLVPAIKASAARLPLEVDLEADELAAERQPEAVENTAYFVVCEALTNVMKHSGAKAASVRMRLCDGSLVVSIADAGRGFDGRDVHRSGLTGLQDRVSAIGGSLEVVSNPGAGTTVTAVLPVGRDG
jgi:signal transduction histidine kinase